MFTRKLVYLAAILYSNPALLVSQTNIGSGTLTGRIEDSSGAPVSKAKVEIRSSSTGAIRIVSSNADGQYFAPSLPVGSYQLSVELRGFITVRVDTLVIAVGRVLKQDVHLQAGGGKSIVDVAAVSPVLRGSDASISTVMDRQLIDNVPLSGRRFTDLTLLSPNVAADGQSGLVSVAGQQGGQDTGYANANGANSYTVDGTGATSMYSGDARGGPRVPYIFGENAIQEFQVAVSPFSAEYGGAAGGFVNAVTRSGTASYHGEAFYFNRNSATGANDAIDKANGIPRPLNVLQQFGASLGGPIARNHAWFFFDYEQQRQKDPISVINPDITSLGPSNFGLNSGVILPAPNAAFPVPSTQLLPDLTSPEYLQNVSNAISSLESNVGVQKRLRNDLSFLPKIDWQPNERNSLSFSVDTNRFDSPGGFITSSPIAAYGRQALASAQVRDLQLNGSWIHVLSSNLVNEFHASYSYNQQTAMPSGLVSKDFPTVAVLNPEPFVIGNGGFANGRTTEQQTGVANRLNWLQGRHSWKFGFEMNYASLEDKYFGGFDPDAQLVFGSLKGTYVFNSPADFASGRYSIFSQNSGNPVFSFSVPYFAFYGQDHFQLRPNLTLDLGIREDFQIYPQPQRNPLFPATGQYPNQIFRPAPRVGFAWQPESKSVVRGGFGIFFENLNGLNYRNSVVSNGLASQQSSATITFDPTLAPASQNPAFPSGITDPSLFAASPNISLVDPHFRVPYILSASLSIEREIFRDTTVSVGTMWTHGIHLIASSAYDLNLQPPTGTTTYIVCPPGTIGAPCRGPAITGPTLDNALLSEGRLSSQLGQINSLISPGINNYNSLFVEAKRRWSSQLSLQFAYTFSKNIQSNGADFYNQFNFRNTKSLSLLDQRHRVSLAFVYRPTLARRLTNAGLRAIASNWTLSSLMQFTAGKPYAALLNTACTSSDLSFDNCDGANSNLNDSAFNQGTPNSALGINAAGPSPVVGINSLNGPWMQQIDVGLARSFALTERQSLTLRAEAFNIANHANFYVQNGTGVNPIQYNPIGQNCGDGLSTNQTCYLVPNSGVGNFGSLQAINALNGPRILQFALTYRF